MFLRVLNYNLGNSLVNIKVDNKKALSRHCRVFLSKLPPWVQLHSCIKISKTLSNDIYIVFFIFQSCSSDSAYYIKPMSTIATRKMLVHIYNFYSI